MQEAIFNFIVLAVPLLGLFAALFVVEKLGCLALNLRRIYKKRHRRAYR